MDETNWLEIEVDSIGDDWVYSSEGRECLLEDEEISPMEAAFMDGYEKAFD